MGPFNFKKDVFLKGVLIMSFVIHSVIHPFIQAACPMRCLLALALRSWPSFVIIFTSSHSFTYSRFPSLGNVFFLGFCVSTPSVTRRLSCFLSVSRDSPGPGVACDVGGD
jgi:hypothetical protein